MLSWLRAKPLPENADCSRAIARIKQRSSIRGVTCTGKTDGGGAQVHAVMSAILFADAIGVPYFHTPFRSVEHSDDPEAFAARWESAFNLGKYSDCPPDDAPIVSGKAIVEGYSGPPAILRQEYFHGFADKNVNRYQAFRERFRSGLALPPAKSHPDPTIAVHVRRGDVAADPALAFRYTPNEVVARAIDLALQVYPAARVVVFSQGTKTDFRGFPGKCEFALNTDIFETISALSNAECLIMSKSSLSYVAGLLSLGSVYYEPFWHKPLSSWRVIG